MVFAGSGLVLCLLLSPKHSAACAQARMQAVNVPRASPTPARQLLGNSMMGAKNLKGEGTAGQVWTSGGDGDGFAGGSKARGKAAMEQHFAAELAAGRAAEADGVEVVAGIGGGAGSDADSLSGRTSGTLLERMQAQLLVLVAMIIKLCASHGLEVEAKHIVFTAAGLIAACGCCLVCRGAQRSKRYDDDRDRGGYTGAPYPGDHTYEMVEVGLEQDSDDEGDENLMRQRGGDGARGGGAAGGSGDGKDSWAWDAGLAEMDDEYGCVLDDGFADIANGVVHHDEFAGGHGVEDL